MVAFLLISMQWHLARVRGSAPGGEQANAARREWDYGTRFRNPPKCQIELEMRRRAGGDD